MNKLLFKNWFFSLIENYVSLRESIIIKWGKDNAILSPFPGFSAYDFHIQTEDSYITFFVGFYKAERPGYVSLNLTKPTHIAVIMTSQLDAYAGIETGFLKNLIGILKTRYKPVPYKEVGTDFDNVFKNAGYEGEKLDTGFTTGQELPDFELGQSATHNLSRSISVSKATGSWAQFFELPSGGGFEKKYLSNFVDILKQAAKPLLDNDLIEFITVQEHGSRHEEIIYSNKGKQKSQDFKTNLVKIASQMKYFAEEYLGNAPKFKAALLKAIDGPEGWFGREAKPINYNLPIQKLQELNNQSFAENFKIRAFLNSLEKPSERVEQLEILSGRKDGDNAIYFLDEFIWNKERMRSLIEPEEVLGLRSSLDALKSILVDLKDSLNLVVPDELEYLSNRAKGVVSLAASQAESLHDSEASKALEIATKVGASSSEMAALDQAVAGHRDRKATREKERKDYEENQRVRGELILPFDTIKYMMFDWNDRWERIPSKYLSGDNDIYLGEFAYELLKDDEGIYGDAYEKAADDAHADVEERPSESYGKDEEEIDSDIEYEADDFAEDEGLEIEDMDLDQIADLVKKSHRNEFIKWKIEKLKEDEENDSRYEPDTESHDFQMKVYKYMEDIAEGEIWDRGLILIYHVKDDDILVQMHEKYWNKFKKKLKETIAFNIKEKDSEDDDPIIRRNARIVVEFEPSGTSETYSANDLVRRTDF